MIDGLSDDEEQLFLQDNFDLLIVEMIDVNNLSVLLDVSRIKANSEFVDNSQDNNQLPTEQLWDIATQEKLFEDQIAYSRRVTEDKLETIYLSKNGHSLPMRINASLMDFLNKELIDLLASYTDIFAWEYFEIRELDLKFYQHKIILKLEVILVRLVKEELEWLLRVGFIAPVEDPDQISPNVVVSKKNKTVGTNIS